MDGMLLQGLDKAMLTEEIHTGCLCKIGENVQFLVVEEQKLDNCKFLN